MIHGRVKIKTVFFFILFFLLFSFPFFCMAVEAPPLRMVTIEEVVSLALRQNPAILQEEEELIKARLNINKAYAVAMPKLSSTLIAGHTHYFDNQDQDEDLAQDMYEFSVGLSQPIYSRGRAWILKKQADLTIQSNESRLLFVKQQVIYQTLHAFYLLLQGKEVMVIALDAQDRLQEHLRVIKVKFEVGQVPETDILRVEAELADAEKDLIEDQNKLKLAKHRLNRYIDLRGPFDVVKPPQFSKLVDEGSSLFQAALHHRSDYQQLLVAKQLAEQGIRLAKSDFYPKLSFNMNYVRSEDTFFPDSPEMQYLGELQIPIFEGTLRFAQVKEARAEYRKSQWILEDMKREIHLQVMQALLDLQKFSASLKATEKQIILAEENLRRIKLQYKEGLASNLDVIDANTLLVKAKIGYTNLNYDQALAYFTMQLALGRLSADEVKKVFHDPKS